MSELFLVAEESNIDVTYHKTGKRKALTIKYGEQKFINLDPDLIETSMEEKVCLAHELGHCMTKNAFYTQNDSIQAVKRREYKADQWATLELIDIDELHKAIEHGIREIWDLAEYFEVTDEFMARAIQIYRNKGLL